MKRGVLRKIPHPALLAMILATGGCAGQAPPSVGGSLQSPPRPRATPLGGPIRTIVLDAGHGGHDPGTSHYGLREKHLTLDIAKRLRSSLQEAGFTVVMTRETDQFIPLSGRPAIANRLQADLFVSIHINANRNREVSGVEAYFPRDSVVASSAQWPPSVRPAEIGIPSTIIREVLWDLVLWRTRMHSKRLAFAMCRSLRDGLRVPCLGVKAARFVVLREAWMPAVLVEVGYVSNRDESSRLRSPAYRQAAAEAIARGILSYARESGARLL